MSDCPCRRLKELKARIDAGEDPDKVIPNHFYPESFDEAVEYLHYFIQVIKDEKIKAYLRKTLEEVINAGG